MIATGFMPKNKTRLSVMGGLTRGSDFMFCANKLYFLWR